MEDHLGHGGMDHGGMDHGGMDHGGMDHGSSACKINMLFNWQIEDTCVVFQWWHISGPWTMLFSCIVIFSIAAGYEWIRSYSKLVEYKWQEQEMLLQRSSHNQEELEEVEEEAIENGQRSLVHAYQQHKRLSKKRELMRSSIYALLVGISFWLMLAFMTYNGYLMMATVLGAGFGHFFFGHGRLSSNKSIQCH